MGLRLHRRVAQEQPLGALAHHHLRADAELEQGLRQLSLGNSLDEQLDLRLGGRGADRVRPLDDPTVARQADRHVLTGPERKLDLRLDPDDPQVGGEVAPGRDGCRGVFLGIDHPRGSV